MMKDGFLNLNKPSGISSYEAVRRTLKVILGKKCSGNRVKVGHAGTLDPLASGVLIIAVNRATRLISYVQNQVKHYRGTFLLGVSSDTEDIEGPLTVYENPPIPAESEVFSALKKFTGRIMHRPPIYSALKVNGKRAYNLARAGKPVELTPREIHIYSLKLVKYAYPELVLDIQCGSGTYIRSLGRDLAQYLGTSAVMSDLVRTAVGVFTLETAFSLTLENITPEKNSMNAERGECVFPDSGETLTADNWDKLLRPMSEAVWYFPRVVYTPEECGKLRDGVWVFKPEEELKDSFSPPRNAISGDLFSAVDASGEFLGVVKLQENGSLRSVLHFCRREDNRFF